MDHNNRDTTNSLTKNIEYSKWSFMYLIENKCKKKNIIMSKKNIYNKYLSFYKISEYNNEILMERIYWSLFIRK